MRASPKELLTEEYLREHYVNQRKSEKQIAHELRINSPNSVRQYLKKFGLTRTPLREASQKLTKEYLEEHYVRQGKSILAVARSVGINTKATVSRALKRHGIKIRDAHATSEARTAAHKARRTGHGEITGRFWKTIMHGAAQRELQFELNIEEAWRIFIEQERRCAYTGIKLTFSTEGSGVEQTASLDRRDSRFGYIPTNVQWVHKKIQRMKWAYDEIDFVRTCRAVAEHRKDIG